MPKLSEAEICCIFLDGSALNVCSLKLRKDSSFCTHKHLGISMIVYIFFLILCVIIYICKSFIWTFQMAQIVQNQPAMLKTQVQSLGQEGPLEKGRATHSSILAWRIPWTEEPGGLQSLGS